LRTRGCASSAVAEVLIEGGVVLLYSGSRARVAIGHCAVDHVEASLPLIQPQLEVGTAAPALPDEVLRTPLNVEDAVRRTATYRREYAKPTVDQIQVVPIREDHVVVVGQRQALGEEDRIRGRELRIAVGRQIDAREGLVVQRVREGQRDGDHCIIPVIASVGRPWHDAASYLSYRVMV
jgi:hypothetical protein